MLGRAPCQHFFARGSITRSRAEHAIVQRLWCWCAVCIRSRAAFEPAYLVTKRHFLTKRLKGEKRINKSTRDTRSIITRHRYRVVSPCVVESLINKAAAQASSRSIPFYSVPFRSVPFRSSVSHSFSLVFSHAFRVKIGLIQCFRTVVDTHSIREWNETVQKCRPKWRLTFLISKGGEGEVSFVPFLYIYILETMTGRWIITCSISNATKSTG